MIQFYERSFVNLIVFQMKLFQPRQLGQRCCHGSCAFVTDVVIFFQMKIRQPRQLGQRRHQDSCACVTSSACWSTSSIVFAGCSAILRAMFEPLGNPQDRAGDAGRAAIDDWARGQRPGAISRTCWSSFRVVRVQSSSHFPWYPNIVLVLYRQRVGRMAPTMVSCC